MSLCDASCKGCIYSTYTSMWGVTCNYILVTGTRRGCPAGKQCTRREYGERSISLDVLLYRGQDKTKMPKKKPEPERDPEAVERLKQKRREYYQTHREQMLRKDWPGTKRKLAEKTRAYWHGRQKEAIAEYIKSRGMTTGEFASMIGVAEDTVRKWKQESNTANWNKLERYGLKRPDRGESDKE